MEFTQEIAVLQSAIVLANKKCGCLSELKKGADPNTIVIITDAISEISHGLRCNLDYKKQDDMKFKMTAVMVALYLSDKETPETSEFWFSILQEMSAINRTVLFDVIKRCHLQQQLFLVCSNVCPQLGAHLIEDLIDYLEMDADDLDIHMWVDFLEYLFLIDNPYFFKPDAAQLRSKLTQLELDVCSNLDKLYNRRQFPKPTTKSLFKDGQVDNETIGRLLEMFPPRLMDQSMDSILIVHLMCVVNALVSMVTGEGILADHGNYLAQPVSDFLKEKSLRNTFSPSDAQALFLQTQDEMITKGLVRCVPTKLEADTKIISLLCEIILKVTKDDERIINLNEMILSANKSSNPNAQVSKARRPIKNDPDKSTQHRIISIHHCCMVLARLSNDITHETVDDAVVRRCYEVLTKPDGNIAEQLVEKKWDWCRVAVSAGLQGHREFFKDCLDDDLPQKFAAKWIDFVEKNLHVLGSAAVMNKWLQFVSRFISSERKSLVVTQIRMITLAAYKKLSLSMQAEVILYAHTHVNMKPVFEGGSQLQMKMTTAFNRLVKAKDKMKKCESAIAVSELLLQAPRETLQKLVHDAVYNKGVAHMLTEILESLPTVGKLKSKDGSSLLGLLIRDAASWDLTRAQETNLVSFVTYLFETAPEEICLLEPTEVMCLIVLPKLVSTNTEDTGSMLSCVLDLFKAVLNTSETGWMKACRPAPLLVCLLCMLDVYSSRLYSEEGSSQKELKERVTTVVRIFVQKLADQNELFTDKCLKWLYNSVVNLHWTALLHLDPLFATATDQLKFPMRIPELATKVAVLPEGWVTFPFLGQGDAMYQTLQAVRVHGVGNILKPVDDDVDPEKCVKALAALAMLLPDSLVCECEAMVLWLLSARSCHRLHISHTVQYAPPLEGDYEGLLQEFTACRMLHNVLQVVSGCRLQNEGPEVNLHVAQVHVAVLNAHCLQPASSAPCDALSLLLTEVFCCLCHQMALLSPGCAEPIYVLLLDVLQTYVTTHAKVKDENPAVKFLDDQIIAMNAGIVLCSAEEQFILKKTISKI